MGFFILEKTMFTFLKLLISPVTDFLIKKQELRAVVKKKELDSVERRELSDIQMDKRDAGWMDDISFYIFLLPCVLAFYPPAIPHITAGFKALEKMPDWYQYSLGLMLVSVWGYRKLLAPVAQAMLKLYLKKF